MTSNKYPGNSSASTETKKRVIETFDQALGLYDEARMDEVVAGCELILQMDDRFEPAARLRNKAQNPSAAIDLSDLAQYRGLSIADDAADHLTDDDLIAQANQSMANGEHQEAIDICNSILARNPSSDAAQQLGAKAYESLEAAPFVTQFMDEAAQAIDRGDAAAARTAIDKARSLDSENPAVAAMESRLASLEAQPAGESEPPADGGSAGGFDFGEGSAGGIADAFSSDDSTPFSSEADAAKDSDSSSFGFTLEDTPSEDQAAEPIQQVDGASPGSFDFSMGEVAVSDDDQSNIQKYLQEGDDLFASGSYAGAIDAWSKIFLIDVTNDEANERIERAKIKKREIEDSLDELLQTGIAAYDRGDYRTAQQSFEEVLAGEPDNYKAQEYLEKLRDHQAATGTAGVPPPPPGAGDMYGDPGDVYEGPPEQGVFDPDAAPPRQTYSPTPKTIGEPAVAESSGKMKGIVLGLVVILLLAAAGYIGYSMFFEDTTTPVNPAAAAETEGKIRRAGLAAEQGRFDEAVRLLSSVAASDPLHSKAVQQLAVVRRQQQTAIAEENVELFSSLVQQGREAIEVEDYAAAKSAFEAAENIQPLEPEDRQSLSVARREMGELQTATALLAQGNYTEALDNLAPILEREPDNVGARRLAGYAWYNRGVRSLRDQRDTASATNHFRSALEYIPNDDMAKRNLQFIEKYQGQAPDLQYEIYIKYLEYR